MNPSLIPSLLAGLAAFPSTSSVWNQYVAAGPCQNLQAYLAALCQHPYSGHLFVGEAPGRKGCAITGIPFSSERVLRSNRHSFLTNLLPSLALVPTSNITERSATVVWNQFASKQSLPAFWNAFPFHPHYGGVARENRSPTAAEISAGVSFLQTVVQILTPHTIVAVGGVAASVTARVFPASTFPNLQHLTFPHPSYRGTTEFISGCASLNIL